jgi:hypothetical protein
MSAAKNAKRPYNATLCYLASGRFYGVSFCPGCWLAVIVVSEAAAMTATCVGAKTMT